ncbi:helix-turn-helix domain-containing protein [Oligoflexia bacterium]|nr:helix-turn-helix domain-containing protein [Oligoflexia bacterium]
MQEDLINLGLTEDEASVYLSMLELGGGYVSQIAKKAGKHRATCYHTLGNLLNKGLATKFEKGKYQFFSPEQPEKIVRQAQGNLERAEALLPELLSIQNMRSGKPKIKFFERRSGIETIFEDTLTAEGSILGYTNLALVTTLFPDFFRKYTKEKVKRKIKTRYLSPQPINQADLINHFFPKGANPDLLEILFINPEEFPFKNELAIYENKVAIMSLSEEEQIAILVESHTFSDTMRNIFDLSWLGATCFVA